MKMEERMKVTSVDYSTSIDFDHPDADWVDATRLFSEYQEQVDRNSDLWRHRDASVCGPWLKGRAPDNKKNPAQP